MTAAVSSPDARLIATGINTVGVSTGVHFDHAADGVIDASDPVFAELRVWVNADTNSRHGEGELLALHCLTLASVSVFPLGECANDERRSMAA